jgi:cell division protein FtsN
MGKTNKYEIKLNKKQILFTAIALIASLLLTFSFGVLTGRRLFQSKKSTDLIASIRNKPVTPASSDYKSLESFQTSRTEGEKTIHQFTFYDTLPKKSELPLTQEMEKTSTKKKKRTLIKKGSKKVKPFDQDMIRKRYTIQLGSFKQQEKAYALQNKLKKQGYLVYVTPKKINGKVTWYRVRMGNFNTPEEAQDWVSKLGTLSPPPFITSATD